MQGSLYTRPRRRKTAAAKPADQPVIVRVDADAALLSEPENIAHMAAFLLQAVTRELELDGLDELLGRSPR